MLRGCLLAVLGLANASAAPLEEWKPYAATGIFPEGSAMWMAPDMERETISAYTARLLEATRTGDAKAMATLGRFFAVRGDRERAHEWVGKAARRGHPGAQFDQGVARMRGAWGPVDLVEAYAWLWLATRGDAPGAEETLRHLTQRLSPGQIIAGVKLADAFGRAVE